MTLPGGPADKLGNRYEKLWTIAVLVEILMDRFDSIRIEAPNAPKTEFVVTKGGLRESHQAKRANQSGKWTLATLAAKDTELVQTIGRILSGNQDRFVFVSGSDAAELRELSEAASKAESLAEFESVFLKASDRRARFTKLCESYWVCDAATAYDELRRIEVRSIGEIDLEQKVRWGIQALFLADPADVLAELQKVVEDSVFRTIERKDLIEQLGKRGYQIRRLLTPQSADTAIKGATDRYLDGVRKKLIGQRLVNREASDSVISRFGTISTETVLTGKAGTGKTACVIGIVDALRAQGTPTLAFRLDRLQSATSTTDLGVRLDLEESPVLVLSAAVNAMDRPGVLIVDQLDAVSTISGRSSEAFDIVERLFIEARGVSARTPIHIVVVCRAFDWRHDARFRQLIPNEQALVEVKELSLDQTKAILGRADFDPNLFEQRQLQLLQLPQNLSLFLEGSANRAKPPTFRTAIELFDRYWDEKRRSIQTRVAPSPEQWMNVVETLCDEIGTTQQLSVPREKLDSISTSYLEQMASEGVLTFDGRRYGFGHESFYDYCFSRVFFKRGDSLVSFIVTSEQHLFLRAQIRQVLVYLRDADPTRYINDLRTLLFDSRIRPHIKDLTLALLAAVSEATDEEWTVWEKLITPAVVAIEAGALNRDELSAMAWSRFWNSPSAFLIGDKHGVVERWLASGNDRLMNVAVNYLRGHQRHSPDRIAELLEPYVGAGGEWPTRLRSVIESATHDSSRRFLDLFLHLIDNGTLDSARGPIVANSTFWSMLYGIGKRQPQWAAEIVAHWLRRRLHTLRESGEDLRSRRLLGYDHSVVEILKESSEGAAKEFVEHLLPLVLDVSDSALTSDTPPKYDAIWLILTKSEHPAGEDAWLAGLASALGTLAKDSAVELQHIISELRRRDTHVANHLLLALYAGGGTRFADAAVALLCEEPWRFQCGYSDSAYWCAMQTIAAIVPHCTSEHRARLESVLLSYSTNWERSKDGYRRFGSARFALLSVFPQDLRSTSANAHFEELERKFGRPAQAPKGIVSGWVGPPIEKSATDVMTDEQWLSAFATYESDEGTGKDFFKGGAWQLARVLEGRTKAEPERFASLGIRLPMGINQSYLNAVLSGVKGAVVATSLKVDLCRRAFGESRETFGIAVADLLGSVDENLPSDTIEMLSWLATEHPDPAEEGWRKDAGNGQTYYNAEIYTNGINTTRGRAARAIQDLILADADYVGWFKPVIETMVCDRSASVRSCVAGTLRAVWHPLRANVAETPASG